MGFFPLGHVQHHAEHRPGPTVGVAFHHRHTAVFDPDLTALTRVQAVLLVKLRTGLTTVLPGRQDARPVVRMDLRGPQGRVRHPCCWREAKQELDGAVHVARAPDRIAVRNVEDAGELLDECRV